MKRLLPYTALSQREVPEYLDSRIIARAVVRSRARKFRKRTFFWSGIAAALCIVALGGVMFQIETQERTRQHLELLALGDFTRLDQSGYNMSFELDSGMYFSQL